MTTTRRQDIDALRVLLFCSLILYHVGMLYVAGWPFHLKSSYQAEWLQVPMLLINRWRMPLLFMISGIAMSFLQRNLSGGSLVANRNRRILVPLLFGMLVIVPIQPYIEGVVKHAVEPGFGFFLVDYFTLRPWPKDAFAGARPGITWNHLWYLAYVWVYSVVVIAAMPLLRSGAGRFLRERVAGLRGGWLLVVPALPKAIALMTLGDAFPATDALIDDWYQHALFFPYFLFGWWIATDPGIWAEIRALRKRALVLAIINAIAYLSIIQVLLTDDSPPWMLFATRALSGLNTWLCILAVLGWSATLLDRPFSWLPYATEAVLPWYVLHQSLIIAVAYVLVPMKIGAVLEPLVVVAFTALGCALLHEFVIRRSRAMRFLFGLKPQAASTVQGPLGWLRNARRYTA
jgi:surface polysaccharide O-acyltransferase-like enzyme